MKAGIIAAGLGERLRPCTSTAKPLIEVAGTPLIDHVLGALCTAGVDQIACIVNAHPESRGIEAHCRHRWPALHMQFVHRTTPSSMESLFALRPLLEPGRFGVLTVDAVFAPAALARFLVAAAARPDAHAVLAVNTFVDDEKPLWVEMTGAGRVTALGEAARGSGLVTAGYYVFDAAIYAEIDAARRVPFTALRQFLGHLVTRGYQVCGERVPKTVDVDRPEDIAVAEAFVRSGFAE